MNEQYLEAIEMMARNAGRVADAICPFPSLPGKDASGGYVASLTEAIMGMTGGLVRIAESIETLAEAVRDREKRHGINRKRKTSR